MLRDGLIPDREEYAEMNQMDKRTNMTKSQEEAEQARWIGDVSPNRYVNNKCVMNGAC